MNGLPLSQDEKKSHLVPANEIQLYLNTSKNMILGLPCTQS